MEENRLQSMWHLEQKQRKTKTFVDQRHVGKENLFDIGKPILVFHFINKVIYELTNYYVVVHKKSTPYYPQANGLV